MCSSCTFFNNLSNFRDQITSSFLLFFRKRRSNVTILLCFQFEINLSITMTSKCGYPECAGYPVALLVPCGNEFCTNHLHHVCQTTTEFNCGIDDGLSKRCYQCLRPIINKNKPAKENVEKANSKSSPRPSASPSNDSSDGESSSSSSNQSNNNQTSRGAKQLRQVIIPEDPSSYKPSLKAQTGFMNCSLLAAPNLFYYNAFEKQASARQNFHEQYGPYAFGKIIQCPIKEKRLAIM